MRRDDLIAEAEEGNTRETAVLEKGYFVPQPSSIEGTGLSLTLLSDLALKEIYFSGRPTALQVSRAMAIPFAVMEQVLRVMRREQFCEIVGSQGIGEQFHEYSLTERGNAKVDEAMARSQYRGPAPVPFAQYREIVLKQSLHNSFFGREALEHGLSHLVLDRQVLERLGPAVNSGEPIFLYGPSGNGKTSIALALGRILQGAVLVPYAMEVEEQLVRVFDPLIHESAFHDPIPEQRVDALYKQYEGPERRRDQRWAICKRPMVIVGGELTLERLELVYDPNLKIHQAPPQVKAYGGLLLIDDFGRQRVHPRDLLNRWIVPLDRHVDYLTLHTGETIAFPFDLLPIFSTNLKPLDLVDEAFLRRVRNKVLIPDPTEEQFREIFRRVCASKGLAFDEDSFDYLCETQYRSGNQPIRACHAEDLVATVIDICRFQEETPRLNRETLGKACETYFAQLD